MAVIINATTTTGLTTSADNSGVIQFQSNGANTVGISSTGYITVGGNQQIAGPAFSAYRATNQSINNATWTKVQCATKEFDTNSNYDNSTNYRFTPTVSGYYQVNAEAKMVGSSPILIAAIYKNGSEFKRGTQSGVGTGTAAAAVVSVLIYLNGSTDYIEFYMYQESGGALNIEGSSGTNGYFQAAMVRGA